MIGKKVNFRRDFDVLEHIAIMNAMKKRLLAMTIIVINHCYNTTTTIPNSSSISGSL